MHEIQDAILHRYYLNSFERVIYTESHDEVANGKSRIPEEVDPGSASSWAARKKSMLGAAIVFTTPGIPMIFQGQEFLEDDWFHDQDPLDWSKIDEYPGILQFYKDLIALRKNTGGVTAGLVGQAVDILHLNNHANVIAYHRWSENGRGDSTVVIANFSIHAHEHYGIVFPAAGRWVVRLNSDSSYYSPDFGNDGMSEVHADSDGEDKRPTAYIRIAPYSVLILSQDG